MDPELRRRFRVSLRQSSMSLLLDLILSTYDGRKTVLGRPVWRCQSATSVLKELRARVQEELKELCVCVIVRAQRPGRRSRDSPGQVSELDSTVAWPGDFPLAPASPPVNPPCSERVWCENIELGAMDPGAAIGSEEVLNSKSI